VNHGSDKAPASGKTSGTRKATDPSAARAPNWAHSELKNELTVTLTHEAHYRCSRTHEKTRLTGDGLVAAFVAATGAANRAAARTRSAVSVDRQLKDMRTMFVAARAQLANTGLSTSRRKDILFTFGGAELFVLAREAFNTSSVANASNGRKPVALGGPAPPACGALETAAGVGEGIPDAPTRVPVLVSAAVVLSVLATACKTLPRPLTSLRPPKRTRFQSR